MGDGNPVKDTDRKESFITPDAKEASSKLKMNETCFEQKAASKFSAGVDLLETITEVNPSWPTPSPERYKLRPDAWLCAKFHGGDPAKIHMSWLSLLATPGVLLWDNVHFKPGGPSLVE